MNYYSQIGQDQYYIEQVIHGQTSGRFLDIGAHDGISTSNTYALETQLSWTGICVEANPILADKCKINRPNSEVIQAAIWSEKVEINFELPHSGNDFLSRIGGIACNKNYFEQDFRQVQVLPMTACTVMDVIKNETYFDYFTLDIEGAELEALKAVNWEQVTFGYIALEFGYRNDFLKEIVEYLQLQNYCLHRINQFDADFVPAKP
jgi:FkbM family methyltransferase